MQTSSFLTHSKLTLLCFGISCEAKMDKALHEDGLAIGDSSPDNYMYDKQGKLWRIDLSSLHELK